MKYIFLISFLINSHLAFSQDDFFSISTKIDKVFKRQNVKVSYDGTINQIKDTAAYVEKLKYSSRFYQDSISPIAIKLVHVNFPDINFTDAANKAYAISDFAGKDVIVNYNYLYCQPCLDRIDSTLILTKNRKVQFLLLFSDVYHKETSDLKNYGENVLIGFISEDTRNLISLNVGDNAMYYLDENRQIDYFDKMETIMDNEVAWNTFLKTHKQ